MKLEKATREHTKFHNRRLIFKTIYDSGEISRVDIARSTNLTRTTVSSNVSELIDEGLVQEVGLGTSLGGKPPTLLSLMDDSRSIIALDLAGNTLRGALVNLRGVVRHQLNVPLDAAQGGEAVLELVYQLIDALIAAAGSPLLGIGAGAPGIIDAPNGIVRQAVNLDWSDVALGPLLKQRYTLPVHIANDSHVAAVAEQTFGIHRNSTNLLVVKVGRGIGTGIIINGQVFHGDDGGAGEIGHVVVVQNGAPCRCGNFGCLETVASSRAIVEQARAIARYDASSLLRSRVDAIDFDAVVAAYEAGDTTLHPLISHVGRYLGTALAHLVGALNINRVVLAGSVSRFGPALVEPVVQQMRQRTLRTLIDHTTISTTTLGNDLVTLGAAALLLSYELGLK